MGTFSVYKSGNNIITVYDNDMEIFMPHEWINQFVIKA